MLEPPGDDDVDDDPGFAFYRAKAAEERAEASVEDEMDPIEASEERQAAMELERMKRPNEWE